MKRYFILPEYADEPCGDADTIEEARTLRDKIARDFISRRVAIIDNDYNEVINDIDYEDIYDNIDDYEYPYNHVNRNDL